MRETGSNNFHTSGSVTAVNHQSKSNSQIFFPMEKKKDLIFKKYTLISFTSEHHTYCKVILANYLRHFS